MNQSIHLSSYFILNLPLKIPTQLSMTSVLLALYAKAQIRCALFYINICSRNNKFTSQQILHSCCILNYSLVLLCSLSLLLFNTVTFLLLSVATPHTVRKIHSRASIGRYLVYIKMEYHPILKAEMLLTHLFNLRSTLPFYLSAASSRFQKRHHLTK